jgi:hypothetical protein
MLNPIWFAGLASRCRGSTARPSVLDCIPDHVGHRFKRLARRIHVPAEPNGVPHRKQRIESTVGS